MGSPPPGAAVPPAGAPGTLTVSPGVALAHVATCTATACKASLAADYATKVTLLP
jgi:hypothetical protein